MGNWKKIRKIILSDPEVKKIYDDLDVEYQIIGDIIRLRNKRKMTQKQLAEKMGTTQSALSRFEIGSMRNPSLNFLKRLASALESKLEVRLGQYIKRF